MSRFKRHPGTIERRGSSWRVILYVDGTRHRLGPAKYPELKGATRNQVEEFTWRQYRRLEQQAIRQAAGAPGACSISELLEQFEREELPTLAKGTRKSYEDSFKPIRDYFIDQLGDPTLDRIFARQVRGFLSWRRTARRGGGKPLSNRTLAKDRAVLHRLFTFAHELEYIDGNPVARVPAPKADPRDPVILTDEELERLLDACGDYDLLRLYILTLAETGARSESEALWIRFEDVDLDEGFIWVASGREGHRTKSGRGRWVPMTPRLRKAMRDHFAAHRFARPGGKPTQWVFFHEVTRRHAKAGERIRSMRRAVQSAAKKAGIPDGWTAHDLRHRRATTLLAEGKSPVLVREMLGHADLRTTMGYTHLVREHLRVLVEEDAGPPATEANEGGTR